LNFSGPGSSESVYCLFSSIYSVEKAENPEKALDKSKKKCSNRPPEN
jgi:hypothetical protein